MEDRGVRLKLGFDDVQERFCVIIKISFPCLNSSYSTSFTEHSLLSNTERYYIIDNEDTSIYIALDIMSR